MSLRLWAHPDLTSPTERNLTCPVRQLTNVGLTDPGHGRGGPRLHPTAIDTHKKELGFEKNIMECLRSTYAWLCAMKLHFTPDFEGGNGWQLAVDV